MKIIIVLFLSLVLIICSTSCEDDKNEETTANGSYSLQIDGETQNITGGSGIMNDKYSTPNNNVSSDGLRLITTIALADKTGVYISFNNTNLDAQNVVLGDYTTDIDKAFNANEFKFGEVTVSSSKGYFSSLGTATDAIKLTKCDKTGKRISGEFDAVLTNKENNETIRVVGSFTDIILIVNF